MRLEAVALHKLDCHLQQLICIEFPDFSLKAKIYGLKVYRVKYQ